MPLSTVDRAALRSARIAVCLLFLVPGVIVGAWTARIPAVKSDLDLTDGQLGVALMSLAVGAISGIHVTGVLVDRFGGTRVVFPAAVVNGPVLILPGAAVDLWTLMAAMFVLGVALNMTAIAMNAAAVAVEHAWDRPIMSSFHAVYSIGGFLGAGIGGAFAAAELDAVVTFIAIAAATTTLAGCAWRMAPADGTGNATETSQGDTAQTGPQSMNGVLVLGLLAACCLHAEGATADWSAVYLRESLGSGPGFAATAFAVFSVMMTIGRLVGDRLAAAFGPVRVVRGCALLASAGLGAALAIGHPVAGVVGFACFGAGLSCIVPLVFSAAGHRNPAHTGRALARVSGIGYLGFFIGPVLIGGVAEASSLPVALLIPVILVFAVLFGAPAVRRD